MSNLFRSQDISFTELQLRAKDTGQIRRILASTKYYPPESLFGYRACNFDGGNDYLDRADNADLSTGDIDFTVAFWFRIDALGVRYDLINKGDFSSANQGEYAVRVTTTNVIEFVTENGAASNSHISSVALYADKWYFVRCWHDSVNDKKGIQVDMIVADVTTAAGGSHDTADEFCIGRTANDSSNWLNGGICNVGFWKRVLTSAEHQELYAQGQGLDYSSLSTDIKTSLISYWELDETTGTRNDSHSTNHLTANGTPATRNGPGNLPIYPLLAEHPAIGFTVGPFAAEQFDTSMSIYASASIDNNFENILSLLRAYELYGQTARFYYVSKAENEYHLSDSGFPNLRATLEVQGYSVSADGVTVDIALHDRWFKDKNISEKINLEDWPNAKIESFGQVLPIAWGLRGAASDGITERYGPIFDAFWIDTITDNPHSGNAKAGSLLFEGWTRGGLMVGGADTYFAFNKDDPGVGAAAWIELEWQADANDKAVEGLNNDLATVTFSNQLSMSSFPLVARAFTVSSARLCTGFRLRAEDVNSNLVDADGPLRISLEYAEIQNTNNLFLKRVLREKFIRAADARILGATACVDVWDEPVILLPDVQYAIVILWKKDPASGGTKDIELYYNPSSATDTDTFYVKTFDNDDFLTKTSSGTGLSIAVDCAWSESSDFNLGETQGYATRKIWGMWASSLSGSLNLQACPIRVQLENLADDDDGTHTGSANALIVQPHDIISSILNTPSAVGLSDTDHFMQNAAAMALPMGNQNIVLNYDSTATDLILKICEQARLRFYKLRNGMLTVEVPRNFNPDEAICLDEADLQGDFTLLGWGETDPSQLVNSFKAYFRRDYLDQIRDPVKIVQLGQNQYGSVFNLSEDVSTDEDDVRQAELAESVVAVGTKDWTKEFDHYDIVSPVRAAVNYIADRYSTKQKRVAFQVLKRNFQSLFLFDHIELSHTKLIGSIVETTDQNYVRDWDRIRLVDDTYAGVSFTGGLLIASYSDGIPVVNLAMGIVEGEIVGIQEQGPYLVITVETMPYFYEEA